MKRRKIVTAVLLLVCLVVLAISLYHILSYIHEARTSSDLNETLLEKAIQPAETQSPPKESEAPATEQTSATEAERPTEEIPEETAPFTVDFEALWEENEDIVAWIYGPDTQINNPVVQAEDNEYYLRRLLDGSYNTAGTLFVDARSAEDFSDWNTIIYGHNMQNGTMFGSLHEYDDPAYYAAHPILYLFTPTQNYKMECLAGYLTTDDAELYALESTQEAREALIQTSLARSGFVSDAVLGENDRILTLSTCSFAYDGARYVLLCILRQIQ